IDYEEGLEENLSAMTTYGLWYIRFGRDLENNHPIGFSEVMSQHIVTESKLMAKKQNEVYQLYHGETKTVRFSVKNNFNSIAWKSSSYLPFRLEELSEDFTGNFLSRFDKLQDSEFHQIQFPNLSIPFLFIKNSIAYLTDRIRTKNSDKRFSLHYAFGDFQVTEFSSTKFNQIPLPENVFYADPFLIEKDGILYLFFEEFDEQKNKGHISVMTIDKNNFFSPVKTVLELPYHLSYPFVFEIDSIYYMIPESSSNKTVSLFKAKSFPFQWELEMHLIENEALIDATIHYENDKWWLFACNALHPFVSTNDQLFIYYSENLFSNKWKPHLQNPVVTTIDNCRPAGRIFRYKNKLYRPAQNNADIQYGYGLKLNEILVLNEYEYREKEVLSIDPAQLGLKACHHIDFMERCIVIDGIK
ncbi:MAG: glucosamine inositolphosphorylceramide transferase family protein, partial [Flavisolibacter sp.]